MRRVNKLSGSKEREREFTGKIHPEALKHSRKTGNWWCISCFFLCRLDVWADRGIVFISCHDTAAGRSHAPSEPHSRKKNRDSTHFLAERALDFGFGGVDLYLECFTWLQTKDRRGLMRQTSSAKSCTSNVPKNDESTGSGCKLQKYKQNVWRWTTLAESSWKHRTSKSAKAQ